jgi:hypothetical protein
VRKMCEAVGLEVTGLHRRWLWPDPAGAARARHVPRALGR